jgi:predicted ATP-grasp superfamily ATP-dependent carboligase
VVHRGGYGDVAIARTLGRLGVPMYLLAQQGLRTPVWASRYWAGKRRWDFSQPESDSLEYMLGWGRTIRAQHGARPLLLTLTDWIAIFIERHGDALQEEFVFGHAERPVVRRLANKWDMHQLATENGIPTPTTICPRSRADVETFLETATLPIVMKPADPYLPHAPSKMIIESRDELLERVDRELARGPLNFVLQEYIPGGADSVWMCNGYFGSNGGVTFTGQKLRQVSSTGIASLAVCVPNEAVAAQTKSFMQGLGYRGCVGIGYRYDERDGRYKLLDVNARVSAVFRLFSGTNDMDVVRVCYLDLSDQDVPTTELRAGRKWMLEEDVLTALSEIWHRRLTVRKWLKSMKGVQETHWFAADDPMPILVWLASKIRRAAQLLFRGPRGGRSSS